MACFNKYTPLFLASIYGHLNIVRYIIERVPRVNLNKGDKFKRTPLLLAVRNGNADIAAYLIRNNADVNLPDTSGNTPLHYAAAYGWL